MDYFKQIFEKYYISDNTTDEELNSLVEGDSCIYVPRIYRKLVFFIDLQESKLYEEFLVRPWQVETLPSANTLAKNRAVEAFHDFKRILEKKLPNVVFIVDDESESILMCSEDYIFARFENEEGHQGIGVFKYVDYAEKNKSCYKNFKESLYDRN